jgi:uncharacterized metal-binding protein YceD (DUF177 family)
VSNISADKPVLDATIRIDNLPPEGRELTISADESQREALASLLEITAVERLDVTLNASRFRGGIRVLGQLTARIEQPCVVTLEPVYQDISEPVDRVFLPGPESTRPAGSQSEIFVDLEAEDPPDHFEGPDADLSGLIVETLALAIDPYPRAPGASLDALEVEEDDEDESPFSSLKALKDKGDKQ